VQDSPIASIDGAIRHIGPVQGLQGFSSVWNGVRHHRVTGQNLEVGAFQGLVGQISHARTILQTEPAPEVGRTCHHSPKGITNALQSAQDETLCLDESKLGILGRMDHPSRYSFCVSLGYRSSNFLGHISSFFGWLASIGEYDRGNPVFRT
jgi:hypothetical protein